MAILINDQRIDDALLGHEFAGIKSYYEQLGNVSCCERDEEFRGYARRNIISRVLLAQHAMNTMPPTPAGDVDAAFEKLKQDHGGELQFYAQVGATPEQADTIRRDIDVNLRVERMVDDLVAKMPAPDEAELRQVYEENLPRFTAAEEVRASHISKAPPRGEQRQEVFELFRDLRRRLKEGSGDFDALAREHSDRGQEQIDLGFFRRGDLPEEFEAVAFSLDVGELSPVFISSVGYHILRVTDRKPARPQPFDEVRPQVEELLRQQRRQQKANELVADLQKTARIEDVAEEPREEPIF